MQAMETDDFLAHYGVKGMRWGVRKSRETAPEGPKAPKPSNREIKEARSRLQIARSAERANTSSRMARTEMALNGEFSRNLSQKYRANPDRVTASYMTTGEKTLLALLSLSSGGSTVPMVALNAGLRSGVRKDQKKASARMATSQ